MRNSRAGANATPLPKILGSGLKRTVVPRRLLHRAKRSSAGRRALRAYRSGGRASVRAPPRPRGAPTARSPPRRRRRAGRRSCRRPCELNFPPECSVVMMTSSADFFLNLGCGSTGMPRPLSVTLRKPSSSKLTSMRVAWPATASSMALSSTSAKRWCRRLLVGAADIHAGPPAHRLEPLEHLDVGGGIGIVGRSPAVPLRLGGLGGGNRLLLQLILELGEEVA